MKRAVLDTNVLVSGLLSPHGPPAALLNKVAADNLSPVYSDPIFEEYAEVLIRPCLHLDPDAVLRWLALFGDVAEYVSPSVTTHPPVILRAAKRSRRIQRLD
ncbi:MAG: putative toxin-antitoxin system toxin component, PIN family, partial [Nitrococcus sp.]|nr:putative toxin-antitoxin system toxin component, PIN family [Nitrococcus sp.]